MKIVNMDRGNGKTTILIHTAYVTGYPIVVFNNKRAEQVLVQAKRIGLDDISVFTIEEWNRSRAHGSPVLIDESKEIIETALKNLLHTEVKAVTFTEPMITIPECGRLKGD